MASSVVDDVRRGSARAWRRRTRPRWSELASSALHASERYGSFVSDICTDTSAPETGGMLV